MTTIAIGCDDAAIELKNTLTSWLKEQGVEVMDYSDAGDLYPDVATAVARKIAAGEHQRGILICGTGIGMCISANKVPGVRAALCHDTYSAERARKSNDAQIITLGARVIGPELAKTLLRAWLDSEFEVGRSGPKVERISYYEQQALNRR